MTAQAEPRPGTYVLWLELDEPATVRVGRLGLIAFDAGVYAYAGSAFGPGGLASRLKRHFASDKKCHWHIDYLRPLGRVTGAWIRYGEPCCEHRWAAALGALTGARLPAPGFGASDCRCASHLVRFARRPPARVLATACGDEAGPVTLVRKFEKCGLIPPVRCR